MSKTSAQGKEKKEKKEDVIVKKKKVPYGAVEINNEKLYLFVGKVVENFDFLEKINQALRLSAEYASREDKKVTFSEYSAVEKLVKDAEDYYTFESERIDLIYTAKQKFKHSIEVIRESLELLNVVD